MAKNIVILSDGTGQRGGVALDEVRTNVYKLFRGARVGPDTIIDPDDQVAYYDPGIGTLPPGIGPFDGIWCWIYNLVCMATGLGLTRNIINCYAAIIMLYEPGDRIFLFGFSRGAYTARCVAAVMALCGVPTKMADGSPLVRDAASTRKLAREAVTGVYQYVSSPRDAGYVEDRKILAAIFRKRFGSEGKDDRAANVYPYFIGVFDTVASVGNWHSIGLTAFLVFIAIVLTAGLSAWLGWATHTPWWVLLAVASFAAVVGGGWAYLRTHVKGTSQIPGKTRWQTVHLATARLKFADMHLNTNVGWARHAISIDERRVDFARVGWGVKDMERTVSLGEPVWLDQVWFAGNHSDIGGGYEENESRLSDISMQWMLEAALSLPQPLQVDPSVLRLKPRANGPQHDSTVLWEYRGSPPVDRVIQPEAKLHPTVVERFQAAVILRNGIAGTYRPMSLSGHHLCAQFFGTVPPAGKMEG